VCPGGRNEQAVNTSQNHALKREYSSGKPLSKRPAGVGEKDRGGRSLPGGDSCPGGRQWQPPHGAKPPGPATGPPALACGPSRWPATPTAALVPYWPRAHGQRLGHLAPEKLPGRTPCDARNLPRLIRPGGHGRHLACPRARPGRPPRIPAR
jgi:hypothetical protein